MRVSRVLRGSSVLCVLCVVIIGAARGARAGEAQVLRADRIVAAAARAAFDNPGARPPSDWEPLFHIHDALVPGGPLVLRAQPRPAADGERMAVVDVSIDGRCVRQIVVLFHRCARVASPVASVGRTANALTGAPTVAAASTAHAVAASSPVTARTANVAAGPVSAAAPALPVIHRGEHVVVRARRGNVECELGGEALHDGSVGDRISVKCAHATLKTRVEGAGEVEIEH